METAQILVLGREALLLMVMASAPPILTSLIVGFVMSVLQASTSIQENTLTVVPKLCAAVVALVVTGPWVGSHIARFATQLFLLLPNVAS